MYRWPVGRRKKRPLGLRETKTRFAEVLAVYCTNKTYRMSKFNASWNRPSRLKASLSQHVTRSSRADRQRPFRCPERSFSVCGPPDLRAQLVERCISKPVLSPPCTRPDPYSPLQRYPRPERWVRDLRFAKRDEQRRRTHKQVATIVRSTLSSLNSHRYTPCHVPRFSLPFETGIETVVPTRAV